MENDFDSHFKWKTSAYFEAVGTYISWLGMIEHEMDGCISTYFFDKNDYVGALKRQDLMLNVLSKLGYAQKITIVEDMLKSDHPELFQQYKPQLDKLRSKSYKRNEFAHSFVNFNFNENKKAKTGFFNFFNSKKGAEVKFQVGNLKTDVEVLRTILSSLQKIHLQLWSKPRVPLL